MPTDNKRNSNQLKRKKRHFHPYPFGLTKHQIEALDEIAKENDVSRSEVSRTAVDFYLHNYRNAEQQFRDNKLERRIQSMEDSLRALLVKSIRVSGQALYFSTLPWTLGFPKQRLSDAGLDHLFNNSLTYAGVLLTHKDPKAIPDKPAS